MKFALSFHASAALLALALPAMAQWKPVPGKMMTRWGSALKADAVWQQYPRPQLERADWKCLNGLWDYAVTRKDEKAPGSWAGKILVPFCPESALSGVGRMIEPGEALWYKCSLPGPVERKRTILNFEAVDYTTTVSVNGRLIGTHTGGFTPFSFDITSALKAGENELLVRVDDATEGFQLRGKQKLANEGIWYTRVSGIWQTVWLEHVNERYFRDLDFSYDTPSNVLRVSPKISVPATNGTTRVKVSIGGKEVVSGSGSPDVTLKIPDPKLWSPTTPSLYDITVELLDDKGTILDSVTSYTALREFGKVKDANGNWRFTLNGKSIFHWGPLDQGWWPDGLLTPPSEEAMNSDIDYLKAAGFNMIRKHIKIEPRRYYYHCDKIGMLMWQDQVSMGYGPQTEPKGSNPQWTRMAPNPQDGVWPDEAHAQFVTEYKRMVDHLRDEPCIAVWSPFNEAWGQHRTMEVGKMAMEYDKTRPLNIASGGNFWPIGDIADEHRYPDPGFPFEDKRFNDYVKVVGEFGGHGMPIEGHLWNNSKANWGYGGLPKDLNEWKERFARSVHVLSGLRKRGVCAGVYTQTTDVEVEINGLLTYDRVPKVEPSFVRPLSEMLLNTRDVVKITELAPSSEKQGQDWRYSTAKPAPDWEEADFQDASWQQGKGGFGNADIKGVAVGTEWSNDDIWVRREFQVAAVPKGQAVLHMFHDEDVEVYLNGQKIAAAEGFITSYADFPIPAGLLKAGRNVLAAHCHQTKGGQYVDMGIEVESDK